jgi:hypothetical protein
MRAPSLARKNPQTRSCGNKLQLCPERNNTKTRGLDGERVTYIGLSKGHLASICRSQRVEKKLPLAGEASLRSRTTPCESPGPHVLGHVHGVGAAAGTSDHVEEGH